MSPGPAPAMDQRFRPQQRIKRRADFQKAFQDGIRIPARYLTLFVRPNEGGPARLGIVASRKLGSAVRRNRLKRLVRELFRRHPPAGTALDIVVIPRREMADAAFTRLEADYVDALGRHRRRLRR